MKILDKSDSNPRDPFIFYYQGRYYSLFSKDNCLWLKSAETLSKIINADKQIIYIPEDEYCNCLWAPELHFIGGLPFIYVTASKKFGEPQHMFVLTTESKSIYGPYKKISYLKHQDDAWAIDGTILRHDGKLYYIYSAFGKYDNELYQALYIVEMDNPYTISKDPHLLSKANYDWEKGGCNGKDRPYVNEGPFALYKDNEIFVVYSASGCWTNNYCLGLLKFKGGDILDIANWEKLDHPIMDNSSGYIAPGHASFIQNGPDNITYCAFHSYNKDCSNGESDVSAYILPVEINNSTVKIKQ